LDLASSSILTAVDIEVSCSYNEVNVSTEISLRST
jgi:hypothetical protein